jgi:hypothetical protein
MSVIEQTALGMHGYDLVPLAKELSSPFTYLADHLPRKLGLGVDITHWKSLVSELPVGERGANDRAQWKHHDHLANCVRTHTIQAAKEVYTTLRSASQSADDWTKSLSELKVREESLLLRMMAAQIAQFSAHTLLPKEEFVAPSDIGTLLNRMYTTSKAIPDILLVPDDESIWYPHFHCFTDCSITSYQHPVTKTNIPIVAHPLCGSIFALSFRMPKDECSVCWGNEGILVETNQEYMGISHVDGSFCAYLEEVLKVRFLGGQGMLALRRP